MKDHSWKVREGKLSEHNFRKEVEAVKKAEQEEAERTAKQAALERYLQQRAETYLDHTATPPTTATLERWREEYVDQQAQQVEAEQQAKRNAAASQPHYHPHI